jgi:PIN domain nuclease of toxin-antitoxin system
MIYLDTHCVVWLYEGKEHRFSQRVLELIQREDLWISPMVALELEYLYESRRIGQRSAVVLNKLKAGFDLQIDSVNFARAVELACNESWTREPFDRIITAHARASKSILVTYDTEIAAHYRYALM